MFDFFKRRPMPKPEAWQTAAQVAAALQLLASVAPGAAYLFARTLHNGRALLDDKTMAPTKKQDALDREIQASQPIAGGSGGLPILALRFIKQMVTRSGSASLPLSAAFGDMVQHGRRYRDLTSRDRWPPVDEDSVKMLAKDGHTCLADVVEAVRAECRQMGLDVSQSDEDVWTIMATFDLRDEARTGRLEPRLRQLQAAVEAVERST